MCAACTLLLGRTNYCGWVIGGSDRQPSWLQGHALCSGYGPAGWWGRPLAWLAVQPKWVGCRPAASPLVGGVGPWLTVCIPQVVGVDLGMDHCTAVCMFQDVGAQGWVPAWLFVQLGWRWGVRSWSQCWPTAGQGCVSNTDRLGDRFQNDTHLHLCYRSRRSSHKWLPPVFLSPEGVSIGPCLSGKLSNISKWVWTGSFQTTASVLGLRTCGILCMPFKNWVSFSYWPLALLIIRLSGFQSQTFWGLHFLV